MKHDRLRDGQFARIKTFLPGRPGTVGRSSELDNRLFVGAVIWNFRSGAPVSGARWRDLPERFGDWKNTHKRVSRWTANGVWETLSRPWADDPDNEYTIIDATIVRARQHSAAARKYIGRSRGDLTTKIHVVVGALGIHWRSASSVAMRTTSPKRNR